MPAPRGLPWLGQCARRPVSEARFKSGSAPRCASGRTRGRRRVRRKWLAKRSGKSGRYSSVLNWLSEKGLSSLTCGLLWDSGHAKGGQELCDRLGPHGCPAVAVDRQLITADTLLDGERPPQPALTALIASRVDTFQPVFKEATHGLTGRPEEVRGMAATAAAVHSIRHDCVQVLRSGGRIGRHLPLLASEARARAV